MERERLQLLFSVLIFGSIGLFVRNIPLPSSQIALFRGASGALFLAAVLLAGKTKVDWGAMRRNALRLLISGGAMGFNWIFLFEAYKYTTIARATLSYYLAPTFVVLLSPFLLKERLTLRKAVCAALSLAGMALVSGVFGEGTGTGQEFVGIGLGILAAVFYASVILMNKFLRGLSALETTIAQLFAAAVILFPYVCLTEGGIGGKISGSAFVLLLLVGFFHTGFCYWLYFSAVQKLPAQTVAAFSYIDPVTAIVLSAFLLKERMDGGQILGAALILGAAFAGERPPQKKPAKQSRE